MVAFIGLAIGLLLLAIYGSSPGQINWERLAIHVKLMWRIFASGGGRMADWAKTACRIVGLAGVCSVLVSSAANAGPPFRTDDPEPVEFGHYEFYTFTSGTHVIDGTAGVGPAFEFNYGVIPDGQFHIIAPAAFNSPAVGPASFGYGDTELGFKYRFIQEDKDGWRPMVGTFPLLELPTGDLNRGLGVGHVRLFLPLWVQKSFGEWMTYGGGAIG